MAASFLLVHYEHWPVTKKLGFFVFVGILTWSFHAFKGRRGKMSWFNPKQKLRTTQPLIHFHCIGMGKKIRRVKVRKLVG